MSSQGDSQPSQDSTVTLMDEDRQEVIYFAYGSNLSTLQMLRRCPSSVPVGLGYLAGWRWIINERGYANIVRVEDSHGSGKGKEARKEEEGVYGLLYLLPSDDEESLDRFEGVPWAYKKYTIEVVRITDERGKEIPPALEADPSSTSPTMATEGGLQHIKTLVYVDERTTEGVPWEEYVTRMEAGIMEAVEDWGMSEEYAAQLRTWLTGETQS
jgi:gamma-glutamylcyclotransferase